VLALAFRIRLCGGNRLLVWRLPLDPVDTRASRRHGRRTRVVPVRAVLPGEGAADGRVCVAFGARDPQTVWSAGHRRTLGGHRMDALLHRIRMAESRERRE